MTWGHHARISRSIRLTRGGAHPLPWMSTSFPSSKTTFGRSFKAIDHFEDVVLGLGEPAEQGTAVLFELRYQDDVLQDRGPGRERFAHRLANEIKVSGGGMEPGRVDRSMLGDAVEERIAGPEGGIGENAKDTAALDDTSLHPAQAFFERAAEEPEARVAAPFEVESTVDDERPEAVVLPKVLVAANKDLPERGLGETRVHAAVVGVEARGIGLAPEDLPVRLRDDR